VSIRKAVTSTLAGALLFLLCVPLPAWAQGGRVTGTVTNARTGDPVETAQVYIPGTRIGTLTDQNGNFTLIVVPAGEYEVRCEIIGYATQSEVVSVGAGETQILEFQLQPSVLRLQELVVTGTAARMPRAKLPFTVEKIDVEDMPVPAPSAEAQIQGKGAGVHVVQGSGQPGDAADIMLRAPTSIIRGQGPLVIVDGVISWNPLSTVDALDIESIEIVKGAAAASLYGSLAANGVIQITTKRGAGLAAGESQITVRGEYGNQALAGDFPFREQHPYAMNAAGTSFVNSAGEDIPYGPGVIQDTLYTPDPDLPAPPGTDGYNGQLPQVTFQDRDYPAPTYNDVDLYYDPGEIYSINTAVTGKTGNTNYRASFTNLREKGIILFHDGYTRRNARMNVDHQVWDNLTLSLSGYYAWSFQDRESGGNLFDLTFMPPNVDLLERTCLNPVGADPNSSECLEWDLLNKPDPLNTEESNPLYEQKNRTSEERNSRIMSSLFARWSATPWLDIEADFGYDRRDRHQFWWTPKGLVQPRVPDLTTGSLDRYNSLSSNVNSSLTAALHKQFGDVIARGQIRYQFEDRHIESIEGWGSNLGAADVLTLGITDPATRSVTSSITDIRSNFFYLVGAADYKGRYIFDGLLRWDGSSLFGVDERWNTYYRTSVAWRLAQEPWWFFDDIGEFKLRFSYGTAGNRPGFAYQYETYSVSAGAISPAQLGNSELKPEFAREAEWGLEMLLFNRFNFIANYSDNKTTDAILNVPLPGYAGFSSQYANVGTIEGNSWELSLETAIAETQDLSWTAKLSWDKYDQTITELGVPPYRGGGYSEFFWRSGEPLGSYWGDRWAVDCAELNPLTQDYCSEFDVNDDGYLVWVGDGNSYTEGIGSQLWGTSGDVNGVSFDWGMPIKATECQRRSENADISLVPALECDADMDGVIDDAPAGFTSQSLTNFLRIGDTTPDFHWSLSSNLRWKQFTLYFLLDSEIGHDQYFQSGQWAMREGASGFVDQHDKSDETKKPYAYYQILYDTNAVNSYYIQSGSYMKVRELSVGYAFNRDQIRSVFGWMGMQGATFRLVGRNLLTFTDYPGYDPETATGTGGSDAIGRTDAYNYPNFRTITATIDFVF
jgi:TonB-linked SusC/RagA family outer membrane protein